MKISRRKSRKKQFIIAAIAGAVVIGGSTAYLWFRAPAATGGSTQTSSAAPANTVDYGPPTAEQQAAQDQQKTDIVNNATGDTTPAPSDAVSISISRAGQNGAGQAVSVFTIVNGASSGTCDFTFTKPGQQTVTKTFAVTPAAASTTCNGDVDASAFGASGDWQLSAVAKKGSETSAPATWTVTVTK